MNSLVLDAGVKSLSASGSDFNAPEPASQIVRGEDRGDSLVQWFARRGVQLCQEQQTHGHMREQARTAHRKLIVASASVFVRMRRGAWALV